MNFALHYILALLVVALCLFGLHAAMRSLVHRRRAPHAGRFFTVIESAMLAQHASIHLVAAGSRRFIVAAGKNGLRPLYELDAAEVAAWMRDQK